MQHIALKIENRNENSIQLQLESSESFLLEIKTLVNALLVKAVNRGFEMCGKLPKVDA